MRDDHPQASGALAERWILVKAVLFVLVAAASSTLLLLSSPEASTAFLLGVALWSTARTYYFAFYVIEKYVDGEFRYSGLLDFMLYMVRRYRGKAGGSPADRS